MTKRTTFFKWAIRISHLLPVFTGLILLIYACIPHLYFFYQGDAHETLSLFELMGNTWTQCQKMIGSSTDDLGVLTFSYLLSAVIALSWIFIIWQLLTAITIAITSAYAFSKEPTQKESNIAKRWLHLVCPNRFCYVLYQLPLLLPAAFPHLLAHCYKTYLLIEVEARFLGPADIIMSSILVGLTVLSALCLIPIQRRLHLNMFRLYKAKAEKHPARS